ncbi:hypothetical protein OQA88_9520 [Cercophora sp. LCS_1]
MPSNDNNEVRVPGGSPSRQRLLPPAPLSLPPRPSTPGSSINGRPLAARTSNLHAPGSHPERIDLHAPNPNPCGGLSPPSVPLVSRPGGPISAPAHATASGLGASRAFTQPANDISQPPASSTGSQAVASTAQSATFGSSPPAPSSSPITPRFPATFAGSVSSRTLPKLPNVIFINEDMNADRAMAVALAADEESAILENGTPNLIFFCDGSVNDVKHLGGYGLVYRHPGPIGVVGGERIHYRFRVAPCHNTQQVELLAILESLGTGLNILKTFPNPDCCVIRVFTDSSSSIGMMMNAREGRYVALGGPASDKEILAVRSNSATCYLRPILIRIREIAAYLENMGIVVEIHWVPRCATTSHEQADDLAYEWNVHGYGLDFRGSATADLDEIVDAAYDFFQRENPPAPAPAGENRKRKAE